jgi:putative thioredoxin
VDYQRNLIRDVDTAEFPSAVLQRSQEVPVVVDFWAAWCGPCKVLGPLLEELTTEYGGAFELAKIDVDANQQLASQFGVQSIPTVIAFHHGRPVANFTGALPKQQLRAWLGQFLPTELDHKVDEARDAALAGDNDLAEQLFREVLTEAPDHPEAGTGLASLLIARGDQESALIVLGKLSPSPDVERLQAAARITAAQNDDIPKLEAALDEDPDDPARRLELASALAGKGEYEPALDHMLRIVRNKAALKDEARKSMLDVFDVLGNEHPLTVSYRRQLASALF